MSLPKKKPFLVLELSEVETRALLHCVEVALVVSGRKGAHKSVPRLGETMYPGGENETAATGRVAGRLRKNFRNGMWYGNADRRRPPEHVARKAIREFLQIEGYEGAGFTLYVNGDETSAEGKCGWGFHIKPDDTTSYLHEDLTVEWYGTTWEDGEDRFGEDGGDQEGASSAGGAS